MAESERLSSDPMNLLVSTSVGMWFWIAILGIHYRPGVAFLYAKKQAGNSWALLHVEKGER